MDNRESEHGPDRPERLENEIRSLRWRANVGLGMSMVFLLGLLSMVATPYGRRASFDHVTVRKLVTEQLHVIAEGHKAYGTFWIGSNGKPQLSLFDEGGSCRMQLQLDAHDSPVLGTYGKNVNAAFELTNKRDGSPVLTLYDKSKTRRLEIDAESDGSSSGVRIFDASGHMSALLSTRSAAANSRPVTALYLLGSGERRAIDLVITDDDLPGIGITDQEGKRRAAMFVTKQGDAVLRASSRDGVSSVDLVAPARGKPNMHTFDGERSLEFAPEPK